MALTSERAAEMARIRARRAVRTRINAALFHLDYALDHPEYLNGQTKRLAAIRTDLEAVLRKLPTT